MTVCYWCGAKDTLADVGKELDDGKYKMVQCSKCKNAYYVVNKGWTDTMRTYNVHVDFISKEGAVLYSRTYPIIAESALMAETWVANILAVLEYQNFRFRETREAIQ